MIRFPGRNRPEGKDVSEEGIEAKHFPILTFIVFKTFIFRCTYLSANRYSSQAEFLFDMFMLHIRFDDILQDKHKNIAVLKGYNFHHGILSTPF